MPHDWSVIESFMLQICGSYPCLLFIHQGPVESLLFLLSTASF